jgi:predicted secreted Zn-dependent protease
MPTATLPPVVATPAILDPPPQSEFDQVESDSPLDPSEPVVEEQSVGYYPVTGVNAFEINQSILQNGPKGNGQDAIAQIEYGISLHYTLLQSPATCAPDEAVAFLTMDFTYPQYDPPPGAPQALLDQWNDFLQRVVEHEEAHAQIARECALETVTDFYSLSTTATCEELQANIEAMQNAHDQACDAEQLAYDAAAGGDSFP